MLCLISAAGQVWTVVHLPVLVPVVSVWTAGFDDPRIHDPQAVQASHSQEAGLCKCIIHCVFCIEHLQRRGSCRSLPRSDVSIVLNLMQRKELQYRMAKAKEDADEDSDLETSECAMFC